MRLLRASCLLPTLGLVIVGLLFLPWYTSSIPNSISLEDALKWRDSIYNYLPSYSFHSNKLTVEPFDFSSIKNSRKYAITSSVQTASFTGLALNLGYSIQKFNDLNQLDADLVLLVRTEGTDGVSAENITRLEQVGWTVKIAEELEFEGVNTGDIRSWHRHNLNKLHLWTWTQYEKIVFIDADVLCKGSLAELFTMPGDLAASPDVWWDVLVDNRFNSGVIVIRPNLEEFRSLVRAVSDPKMHSPNDADQAFLNNYYKFRYFGLPFKYNLNLVMYHFHRRQWDKLFDEAVLVHFTTRKPHAKDKCDRTCAEWEVLSWYSMVFQEMISYHGFEGQIPVLG